MYLKINTFLIKYLNIFLFTITLIIGLFTYHEYGFSWDELTQYQIGHINYDYIFLGKEEFLSFNDRDYGIAFELPLVILEKIFNLSNKRDIFLFRHLLTHIFFLFSASIFYLLIDLLYKNKLLASLGFLFLVLNPVIYTHSFFNTKDIPLMSMFIICFYLSAKFFKNKTKTNLVLLSISTGLLINFRIVGALFGVIILLFFIIDIINLKLLKERLKEDLIYFLTFIITSSLTLYISWPYLWINPIINFINAFNNMSQFRWKGSVLFKGSIIKGTDIPWDYIPVLFSITNPIIYLIIGIIGFVFIIFHFIKTPFSFLKNIEERNNLLYLLCFILTISSIILFNSVLYNSWRQLYFIYPSFIMIGIYGLNILLKSRIRKITISITFFSLFLILIEMINNYPNQSVYFNEFVDRKTPEYLKKNYDLDYWGVSYKQSLEYILKNDIDKEIFIVVDDYPGELNAFLLNKNDRKRIKLLKKRKISQAKYFITINQYNNSILKEIKPFHSIVIYNNTINNTFKLK